MPSLKPNEVLCPASATHPMVALSGVVCFLISVLFLRVSGLFSVNVVHAALFVLCSTAAGVLLPDVLHQKIYRKRSTGLDLSSSNPSLQRTVVKLLGLAGCLAFIGGLYWLFPEYSGAFYARYFYFLSLILPALLVLAGPYIYFVDSRMTEPRDGYWHLGEALSLRTKHVHWGQVRQTLIGWLIKGFFVPLMFTYMCNDLERFMYYNVAGIQGFQAFWDFAYSLLYFIDVGLVTMAYLLSLRLIDTHLRSGEPTLLGWGVALVCYEPFWSLFGTRYLAYNSGFSWGAWLAGAPALYVIWGSAILALTGIYVWATVSFGARFSNLTHRGIITSGPYRFTKHPAYVAKNLSWWMISVPFLIQGSGAQTLRHCLMLLGLNLVYLWRAKTEERHLSNDPTYVAYAAYIAQHGLFRALARVPGLRYDPARVARI